MLIYSILEVTRAVNVIQKVLAWIYKLYIVGRFLENVFKLQGYIVFFLTNYLKMCSNCS